MPFVEEVVRWTNGSPSSNEIIDEGLTELGERVYGPRLQLVEPCSCRPSEVCREGATHYLVRHSLKTHDCSERVQVIKRVFKSVEHFQLGNLELCWKRIFVYPLGERRLGLMDEHIEILNSLSLDLALHLFHLLSHFF